METPINIIRRSRQQTPIIRHGSTSVAQPRKAGCGGRQPLRRRPTTTRRGGACPRPFCRTQVFVGGRFVNRPYGGPLVSAVGARPRAPRRPDPSFLDPFRHGACVRRAATPPLSGEARADTRPAPTTKQRKRIAPKGTRRVKEGLRHFMRRRHTEPLRRRRLRRRHTQDPFQGRQSGLVLNDKCGRPLAARSVFHMSVFSGGRKSPLRGRAGDRRRPNRDRGMFLPQRGRMPAKLTGEGEGGGLKPSSSRRKASPSSVSRLA